MRIFFCCEEKDRTSDLRVMSPTSYRCSTSHCKNKGIYFRSQKFFFFPLIFVLNLHLKIVLLNARISGVLVKKLRLHPYNLLRIMPAKEESFINRQLFARIFSTNIFYEKNYAGFPFLNLLYFPSCSGKI